MTATPLGSGSGKRDTSAARSGGGDPAHGYYTLAAVLTVTGLFVLEITARLAGRRPAAHHRSE